MSDARIHVERAAAGFVVALFLAAALLLAVILFRVIQDARERAASPPAPTAHAEQFVPLPFCAEDISVGGMAAVARNPRAGATKPSRWQRQARRGCFASLAMTTDREDSA